MMPFAEADMMPGWFGVILQGGSFAVVVFLVVYLFPRWRREVAVERDSERAHFTEETKAQRVEFLAAIKDLTATFRQEAGEERKACERHFATLAEAMGRGNEATVQAIRTMFEQNQTHSKRNQQWIDMMTKELEKKEKAL